MPSRDSQDFRGELRRMFASIAPRYDLLNRLLSAGQDQRWRRRSVEMLSPGRRRVLDLAAGTGDLSIALLRSQPEARIFASDFVPEMCRRAREKGGGRLAVVLVADALRLPFADESFDAAMVAFGVRNFESVKAGLAEAARVLEPGGELLVLEFFPSRYLTLRRLFKRYFQSVLPRVGRLISRDREAYSYLPRSVGEFHSRGQFAEALEEAGFGEIRTREFSGGIATAFVATKA